MILSVNISQPFPTCDRGLSFSTVMIEFNKSTPCLVQEVKSLFFLTIPKSFSNSLKIYLNEGGALTSFLTENDKP